jgi:hypothetical protein
VNLEEVMQANVVCLYLDSAKFGCGWRDYVAVIGRKWVRLVLVATGESGKITITEYNAAMASNRPGAYKPKYVAKRLRKNAKRFGNNESAAVKEALSCLRVTAQPPQ